MIKKNLEDYSKKHFIKKCPNCGIYTEKSEGCNHITCSGCNYQWCWLCNKQYNSEHYLKTKCRGFQFFQPKNENDIKLAFEGKIVLKERERQIDIFPNQNFNDECGAVNYYNRRQRYLLYYYDNYGNNYPDIDYRNLTPDSKIKRSLIVLSYFFFGHSIMICCYSPMFLNYFKFRDSDDITLIFYICYYFIVFFNCMIFFFLSYNLEYFHFFRIYFSS